LRIYKNKYLQVMCKISMEMLGLLII